MRDKNTGAWCSAVAGMLVLIVGATACGESPAREGSRPRKATAQELALLDRGEEALVQRCMARHGFRYRPAPPRTPDEQRDFPYVVDDPAWARRHGYGGDLLRRAQRQRTESPNASYVRRLSPERRQAYFNALSGSGAKALEVTVPVGAMVRQSSTGCIAEAQGRLYGDFREWFRADTLASNIPDHGDKLRSHPDFRTAVRQWSDCMRAKGLPYQSPAHLQRELEERIAGASVRRAHSIEVRLATAEAACARSTSLAATVHRLTRHYALADQDKYGSEIEARDRMRLAALDRAGELAGRR
ncbi:hypothetical protein AB0I77_01210 [Streptomyces sp. NPDC050619]|uniref:hypothetical protein n=1 Tax=Streptomyces sp. NPDC050619 TaxID=3157214 RepID=UPI003423DF74